jgi:hypothetical protein
MDIGKKKIINLSSMDMDKRFSLHVIHWLNYINIYIVKLYKYIYIIISIYFL